jgi:hypothetical protein
MADPSVPEEATEPAAAVPLLSVTVTRRYRAQEGTMSSRAFVPVASRATRFV